ncbi:hypothetical protein K2173_011854 [Erythroxylum novogranatense]|uniref:Quinolinate synthase, chloroplastic n=1 Tax=Erythroxylum novogranatense TaxID=1862640 RepID=A0AAV8S791_9ROSI|nr:hypothetical protein K2173_011854 [Erythroxylum novogranatense]
MESSATMSLKPSPSSYTLRFASSSNPSTNDPRPRLFPSEKTQCFSSFSFKSIKSIHLPPPDSKPISSNSSNCSPFSCSAVTFSPTPATEFVPSKLNQLIIEFQSISQPIDRVKRLLQYANLLPAFPDSSRVDSNRVMGCTAQVWLEASLDQHGKMRFWADSDSEVTRGFCACLIWVLDGATPEEVLSVKTEDLTTFNVGLTGGERMRKRTKKLIAEREGKMPLDPFPSLVISSEGITAQGSYAEAQARYLFPDEAKVQELVSELKEKKIGVVAHFYMDPEVQGVLTAAQKHWPHIHISDSLVMADSAVKMAKAGCKFITVLGVDFMSENVRAILDQAGFQEVSVYRMSSDRIGCSLADAASSPAYMNYLEAASAVHPSLHVVYINTSLETKAYAHELVPTITCTSSNVVQTILQAFSQIPDLNIWYGPDSYMGANIVQLFQQMTIMTDEEIAEVHPAHNRDSIKSLLPRLHYYQDGTCIVHHLFGHEVVEKINEMYCDAFLTAHLEVPGEMFSLAMEAKRRGMGVVGSTQNLLDFIKKRVQEAVDRNANDRLQFVLGTESGMVTSIVAAVQSLLRSPKSTDGAKVTVEIVFPVSSESITKPSFNSSMDLKSAHGCSIHGDCASCPYMKVVTDHLPHKKSTIEAYEAARFKLKTANGNSIADVGCEPILHMRHFQASKELPDKLVHQTLRSNGNGKSAL